ncbi:hypothetical protein F66182_7737 [Fusarium sp. NRRL 66182]|nr:hypothetical protein F66182_7737 [Fusarium sp. NRRL 66182]
MSNKRLLLFTNSDYGQANAVLATAHALGLTCQDFEIHIASFQDLERGVDGASRFMKAAAAEQKLRIPKDFVFHKVEGTSWGPATKHPDTAIFETLELAPGLVNSAKGVAILPAVMIPWGPEEFMRIYRETERVFDKVHPDLTIVEPLYTQALTLCHHRGVRWMVLSPNTIKEFAVPLQPRTNEVLRNKMDSSITLMTMMELGVLKPAPPGLPILVANSPDIDYPFSIIPPQLTSCGPIVRPAPLLRQVDAPLAAWISRGPTIYANLGTHHRSNPAEAYEMAKAFRDVLRYADELKPPGERFQILWKLGRTPDKQGNAPERDAYTDEWALVHDTLQPLIDQDRARVTDWLVAEPKSVLESQNIVCSVNHGGANSFHESLCSGVPQALLPAWTDCYDFANRVELLGIGRWANKKAKPRWKTDELADAMVEMLFGPDSAQIRRTAEEIASRHPEWEGRQKAAQEILRYLSG